MNRYLRIFLFCAFLYLPQLSYSTHIVGGSLTYVLNPDSSYTVTLKLYRDCAGVVLPPDVDITVLGYNGVPFNPSKDFTMPRISITQLPSNLDSCAVPPTPMPCVQEGIYTLTVTNLPPNPGGYHMYCQIVARNNSLSNINTPGSTGESFYAYIPGQSVVWLEEFTLANGTTVDNGTTAWSVSTGTIAPNSAQVNNNLFEITGANNARGTWASQVISITSYTAGVNVSIDLSETGNLDVNDSILVYYSLNGGPLTLFPTNGFFADDFTNGVSRASGLIANTIQLFIRARYDAASPNSEIYMFDNILVYGNDFIPNDNPVFTLFPPLFLCAGKAFTFDHSATDADGDSLAYSFYTPYDGDTGPGAKDPTFPGNVASFLPVSWLAGFSATNPLGGTPLVLNPTSGLLSGTPSTIGQFVVGVKVKEYRNGVLISETLRDFQFNIVNCPPLAQAGLVPINACSNTVSFSPQDTLGTRFWWNFGNTASTTDTSILKFPSYTYPGIGTYTMTLIANKGTYCADTATSTVTVSWITSNFTHNAPRCVGSPVSFTDNSTRSANCTIASWAWGFGDGSSSTSTSQNPSHTYSVSGIYNVTLTATSSLGCQSIITRTISIDPQPIANAGVDQTVCANNAVITLNGSVTNATGGTWTRNGTGTFAPSTTTLNATYTPSNADTAAGSVTFTLTTTGNATCNAASDVMVLTITDAPTNANAGPDQTVCGVTSATLAANTPTLGTGQWTVVSGAATITSPSSPTTSVTGLTTGSSYTFRWTISSASCNSKTDDVTITVDLLPTTANAGADIGVCNGTTATLSANTPAVGIGTWSVIAGSATVTTPSSPTSGVTGLIPGDSVTLRWTISQGLCGNSDVMKIRIYQLPTASNAGLDQTLCGVTSATISANTPAVGTGLWTMFSGAATITNPASATTGVTGLVAGSSYTFRWTISNGVCPPSTNDVIINMDLAPTIANAGPDQTLCGVFTTTFSANNPAVGTGVWTLVSGAGNITSSNSPTSTVTGLGAGSNTFRWTTSNSSCSPSTDDMIIYVNIPPTPANAGPDQNICGVTSATLTANTPAVGTGIWTVVSGAATITNPNSITTTVTGLTANMSYTFRWTINATCPASLDDIVINVGTSPTTANAGPDQNLCNTATTTILANTPTVGSGTWTIIFGTATVTSPLSPASGVTGLFPGDSVILRWTTTQGFCNSQDELTIIVNPITTSANAGTDQITCSNSNVQLNGIISGGSTTGGWSTFGSGSFLPDTSTLNGSYVPSANDISAGLVQLVLASTNNGICAAVKDTIQINFFTLPVVSAGTDQGICSTTPGITLNGTISGGTSVGTWTTTGTGTFLSNTSLNTSYNISAADVQAGTIYLILTSTSNGPCPAVADSLELIISQPAVVSPGSYTPLCSNVSQVQLNGFVSGGSSTGRWTSGGTGTFSNDSILNATYVPSASDLQNGVYLTLTSTNNGACTPVYDSIHITFVPLPVVNAGSDQTICSSALSAILTGTVSGATSSGIWSGSGVGSFTPNNTSLNTSYNLDSTDINSGNVLIILTSTNNGPCPAVSDTLLLDVIHQPSVSLVDTSLCSGRDSIQLIGTLIGDTNSVLWVTSGTGSFQPSNQSNPVYYIPSAADNANGLVSIKFISANNAPCTNDTATMILTLYASPIADFSASKYVSFAPNDPITFNNTSSNANSYYWDFGDGSFSTQASLAHNYLQTGKYIVTLVAENIHGCTDTISKEIIVSGDVIFPTAFTPDKNGPGGGQYDPNDLSNNTFFPFSAGITEFHMLIFNRWGELIFETNDVKTGWDGYYRGKMCQQDTYVWKAEATFNDGRTFGKKGSVTLLR